MAWNRPNVNGKAVSRPLQKPKGFRFLVRGAITATIVVLGAAVAAWWIFGGGPAPVREDADGTARRRIREVKPVVSTNVVKKTGRQWPIEWHVPDGWDKPYPPQAYRPDGTLKKYSRYVEVVTNKVRKAFMPVEQRTFTNFAEQRIAGFLIMEPGGFIVDGGLKFDKFFVKHFLKSLDTPIKFADDDTEFQKSLKQAVIDAKKELKARYDAGEDIAKIMNDSFAEMKELSLYRKELEDQVARLRLEHRETFTEKDVKDLIDAANKMLADRGCKPLTQTKIFECKMKLQAARQARKNKTL